MGAGIGRRRPRALGGGVKVTKFPPAQIAEEMNRLLALPASDTKSLPFLYKQAVENLTKKEKSVV